MTGPEIREELADWQLERFLLGELPPDEGEVVRRGRDTDERVRGRLRAIERSNVEILERHSPAAMAARIRARLGQEASAGASTGRRRVTLAAAASIVAVATVAGVRSFRPAPADLAETRIKGMRPRLLLFRKAPAAGVERLVPGSLAHDRDLLQVVYQAAGRSHGVILSVDGRGTVTRHLPVTGMQAAPLQAGPAVPLGLAYQLDDAPGFERFYFVTADAPFAVEVVEEAVRRQPDHGLTGEGHLYLPPALDQFTFVLRKEPSR